MRFGECTKYVIANKFSNKYITCDFNVVQDITKAYDFFSKDLAEDWLKAMIKADYLVKDIKDYAVLPINVTIVGSFKGER